MRICVHDSVCQQESKMENFFEFVISPSLKEQIARAGFVRPTPVQSAAIPPGVEGKDLLATAQTGTGKTLAFLIPILERLLRDSSDGVAALILVPTRELAMQVAAQHDALRGRKLPMAALIVGGLSEYQQLQALRRGSRVVVATPGRLGDFLDRRLIQFDNLRMLVLDEADRMLDMGFRPAIRRIVAALPKERQTMCFSATMEGDTARLVVDYTRNPVRLTFGSTLKPSENVRLQAVEVAAEGKSQALRRLLKSETGQCLVFARTKRGSERVASQLNREGIQATVIHGDRSQSERTAALRAFQQRRYRVLVATDLASRGIHVENIAHVINYDLPEVAENFIHRVGRTGRAGNRGTASTLFLREQRLELLELERKLGIHFERMRVDGLECEDGRRIPKQIPSSQPRHKPSLVQLPGEVLQLQTACPNAV
jgi:ATP-dependent RNA helicase RhlE